MQKTMIFKNTPEGTKYLFQKHEEYFRVPEFDDLVKDEVIQQADFDEIVQLGKFQLDSREGVIQVLEKDVDTTISNYVWGDSVHLLNCVDPFAGTCAFKLLSWRKQI